jgi:hypothetical protein
MLSTNSALESVRRAELLDSANADGQQAIEDLAAASEDLESRRDELESRRAEQAALAEDLAAQQAALDAQLSSLKDQARAEAAQRAAAPRRTPARTPSAAPARPASAPASPAPPSGDVSAHHDDPFLTCTRAHESRGDYTAVNPAGYYGAYQFAPSTWDVTANHAGRIDLVGVLPTRASPSDQDELAWVLYQWQGKKPWGGRC